MKAATWTAPFAAVLLVAFFVPQFRPPGRDIEFTDAAKEAWANDLDTWYESEEPGPACRRYVDDAIDALSDSSDGWYWSGTRMPGDAMHHDHNFFFSLGYGAWREIATALVA